MIVAAVQAPRLPRVYVPRTRLWNQLDDTADASVRLLVAPVGAGKTLGVGGWVRFSDRVPPTRWISGDRSWTPERMTELLDDPDVRDPFDDSTERTLVVVDDAHLLPPATLRVVDQRLCADPEQLQLLLLARYDLPFTRLMPELLGHFSVIRGEVLRMDEDEAHTLIVEHARTDRPEVLEAVTRHAQGWSAALVLAARSVATAADPVTAARRFGAGDASIASRLGGDVFAALQPRERHLLLSIATEERVTTDTAAHLSHDDDAAEILSGLEFTGLLVSRLPAGWRPHADAHGDDDETPCYRIHPLLVEVVRRRLRAGGVDVARAQRTVRRAVRLDIASGHPEMAFARLVATQQFDEAAMVLGQYGPTMLIGGHGEGITIFARNHADAVDAHPDTWFVLALERWLANDTFGASHWLDHTVEHPDAVEPTERPSVRDACVRLMRARMGSEPLAAAVRHAVSVMRGESDRSEPQPLLPLLYVELGVAQTLSGELAEAETNLSMAVSLCQTRGLTTLEAATLSHLALNLHMQGHEHSSGAVADEALRLMAGETAWKPVYIEARATLARDLARLNDAGGTRCFTGSGGATPGSSDSPWDTVHAADPVAQFWHRIRTARQALTSGQVIDAEQVLQLPSPGTLSDHLQVVLLVELGFLTYLADDEHALPALQAELEALGARGEAALLDGMRHELAGERKPAAAAYAAAAEGATYAQPATRAFALAAQAQILDVLGEGERALELLREATTATEVRRNAAPFLGWSRQGTPIQTLLARLLVKAPTAWVRELAEASAGNADIVTALAAVTAAPRERAHASEQVVRPTLSAREREVLNELARGATYADIASSLFVSGNTVKTHVSSLYGKLAVSRRSEALAVARNLHLI
jgi:LuxR family maltose regulon positive regulatory protein